jgi:Rad52/22 family double-strand break repair protein
MINLTNEVFGFNGWSSSVVRLTTDFIDLNEETRRYTVGVTAIMRVTLRDGVFHEDIGYGILENSKSKGAALDKVCVSYLYAHYMMLIHSQYPVQERSRDRRTKARASKFWEPPRKLSIR